MACILLWSSAVRVHDSQAYRKMNVTRGQHQSYLGAERNTLVNQNWFQPCQCCCCLCYTSTHLTLYRTHQSLSGSQKLWGLSPAFILIIIRIHVLSKRPPCATVLTGGIHNDLSDFSIQMHVNCLILLYLIYVVVNEHAPLLILNILFRIN